MAKVDADINYIIFHIILPIFLVLLIVYYIFGMNIKKLDAVIQSRVCGWLHRRYVEKEKQLLFEQLGDLKLKSKGPFSILEIGVGSGVNFNYYPRGTHLSFVDPNPYHEYYWRKNLEGHRHIKLVESLTTFAEHMPEVKSNSYDVVVCTLTLCSVKDPPAVLGEINRVLKPGGTFFYLEHVAGKRSSVIRLTQNLLQPGWYYISSGCHLNRETWNYLDKSEFESVQYRQYSARFWLFFFARPFLYGTAVKKRERESA